VPDDLAAELKEEIGVVARQNGSVQAILELKSKTHMGLSESQASVIHLADKHGWCQRW
jgi:hypothetical protein